MSENTVKIGIAGCGWIAGNGHIPAFKSVKEAKIVSVFDIDIIRAKEFASDFEIKNAFNNYNDFLKSGIDAVIISTPNYTHGMYILEALKNDKHVLCEKPFAIFSCECEEILKLAQEKKKVVIPGHVNRFREDVKKLYEESLSNIGKIKCIEAGWIRKSGVPRLGTWFTSKKLSGGGVLIDLGSHIIDLCLMLMGPKTIKNIGLTTAYNLKNNSNVSAQWFVSDSDHDSGFLADVEDTADVVVIFDDNTEINIKLSWMAPVIGDCTYFSVIGEEEAVELKTLFGFSDQRLWQDSTLIIKKDNKVETITMNICKSKTLDAFCNMAHYFVNAIIEGVESEHLTLRDGYNTVKLIESLYDCEKVEGSDAIKF